MTRAGGVTRKLAQSRSELSDKRPRLACRMCRGGGRDGIKGSSSQRGKEEAKVKGGQASTRVASSVTAAVGGGNQAQAQAALGSGAGSGRGLTLKVPGSQEVCQA